MSIKCKNILCGVSINFKYVNMTDLKLKSDDPALENNQGVDREGTVPQLKPMQENQLIPFAELLFFAYRDFVSDPDEILNDIGFGRAHHRVLHFVNQEPGLRVADLLEILKITKQSLARVLKQLIDDEYIKQETGKVDRRERHLFATDKGQELARTLMEPQFKRIKSALEGKNKKEQDTIIEFLYRMIEDQDETIASNRLNKILRQSRNNK